MNHTHWYVHSSCASSILLLLRITDQAVGKGVEETVQTLNIHTQCKMYKPYFLQRAAKLHKFQVLKMPQK